MKSFSTARSLSAGITTLLMGTMILGGCSSKASQDTGGDYIGPAEITIADGKMTPEVLLSFGRLSDPQLSPDGKYILYGVSYTSIADDRSCRNIFVCNADGSGKVQLTKDGKSVSNARWSSDGKKIRFIQGGQIWEAPVSGLGTSSASLGTRKQLSDVENGVGEFSYSPDESQVMYVSYIPSDVKSPKDINSDLDKAKAYVTEDLMYRHWDNWVTELPHTYVASTSNGMIKADNSIDILGGPDQKFELPLMPYGGLEQLSWSPDGRFIAYSCKKKSGKEYAFSTDTEIYIYQILTGETTVIPMGGGYDTDPVWSPDGKKIAWISMERDGYEADKTRLMVADLTYGGSSEGQGANPAVSNIRDLTASFKYNAASPAWSADSKGIYFNALVEGLQGIFISYPDSGNMDRLTADDLWYDFGTPFGVKEDGTLLSTYASMDFPTEMVSVLPGNGPAGKDRIVQVGDENGHLLSQLASHETEMTMVKTVDGKDMLTWILYPPKFDPSKKYPAIEILLGGPQGTLSQGWSYRWNYCLMAHQGYVVVLPNRRGTTAFGPEWTEEISGDYVGLNMQDYLSAARMIKEKPFVDKLAACGASYGGFSVYYLAGIHGDTYDCFIAHAGIFDEKYMYYETEEMWFPNWDNGGLSEYEYTPGEVGPRGDGVTFGGMKQGGSPWSNLPKAQRHYANSPAVNVTAWHTPILCIHGMMDYRIPYDQGMAAFNAAQMMGVPSKLIVFPEECHWILKPQNALFWHREYFDWLDRWCK
ncbi:MAG: S9 family peptidase [Bacteroidales bacterium]|nr:S9 family peptidase [Bacteroidales bacterium]